MRYAACVLGRALLLASGGVVSPFLSTLVPHLLFNRHDVAEGVRRYSLETWQLVMAGEGPAWVARCIDLVLALHLELQPIIQPNGQAVHQCCYLPNLVSTKSVNRVPTIAVYSSSHT